jgi:hypothetical protein
MHDENRKRMSLGATRAKVVIACVGTAVFAALAAMPAVAGVAGRTCYPGFTIPAVTIRAVTIPAVTIPAVTIPRTCVGGTCLPAQHLPAQHLPAQRLPAQHLPAQHVRGVCLSTSSAFALPNTSIRVSHYGRVDGRFSSTLTSRYWRHAGRAVSYPNPYASGFGELNGAGFPRNQYVRPYFRRDGTFVNGYWRNSSTDGLPTCRIIRC